jgi:hypothetical protein
MKAVAMCGGLVNPKAKIIKIIRADGTIVTVNAKNIWGAEGKRDTKQYVLYPGDTMYVPESFEIPWNLLYIILATVSLSISIILGINALGK